MQIAEKRLWAFAVAACLIAALAFAGAAMAAPGAWWVQTGNTLTVSATNTAAYQEDIAKADVVVDLVKMADATPRDTDQAFTYEFTGEYSGLSIGENPDARAWGALAADAAAIAKTTAGGTVDAGKAIGKLDDGLYLVLAHGRGETGSLTAESDLYAYSFAPTVVALPSKQADADGVIRTDGSYGEWVSDVSIALKPERRPLYGSLRIVKNVQDFSGEPATFVFHLTGTTPEGKAYDNYASVYFTGGTQAETVVTHIPAGTELSVSEEYGGARYELVSGDDGCKVIVSDSAVAVGGRMAEATFTNRANGSGVGGHGIENNYELGDDGDWAWTATPAQDVQVRR